MEGLREGLEMWIDGLRGGIRVWMERLRGGTEMRMERLRVRTRVADGGAEGKDRTVGGAAAEMGC